MPEAHIPRDLEAQIRALQKRIAELEQAGQLSEARLRQVIDLVPHFIFAKNAQGQFILVNQALADAFGTTVEDLLGKTDADINPNEDEVRHFREDDMRVMESGEAKLIPEETITDSSGGLRYLQTIKIPYQLSGTEDPAILGVAVDITDRKRAEEETLRLERQLLHTQKLESLGILAGGIAHDFNNLLVGILGNAELALNKLGLEAPSRQYLQDVVLSGQRAADLCNQMLAYSGRGKFVVEPVDLSAIVQEMLQLLEVSVSKSVSFDLSLDPGLPAVVADPTQIRQVVMNLVTNASESMGKEGGVIRITTGSRNCESAELDALIPEQALTEGVYAFLEVEDSGSGIDDETRRNMFDPFYTTKFAGRGLGLSAVLGIVRAHAGGIRLVSNVGSGSTFTVFFPTVDERVVPAPQRAEPLRAHEGGIVLVVDDEFSVRTLASRVLEDARFDVLQAENGYEALDIFRREHERILAVLLDMTMPNMNGLETAHALRAVDSGVRVILSSGYSEDEATRQFGDQDLSGFLQKPYRPQDLVELIVRLQRPSG